MSYVIFDVESNIVTGFSESINEIEGTVYFHDASNDIDLSHGEFDYREAGDIPRHIVAYNYVYRDGEGFSRLKSAQEILNERKAMLNSAKIRMDKMQEAIEKSAEAASMADDVGDAVCEQSMEMDAERKNMEGTLRTVIESIEDLETALCELSIILQEE